MFKWKKNATVEYTTNDIQIVDIYNREEFNTLNKSDQRNRLFKKYLEGSITGMGKKNTKNFYALQDILFYHLKNRDEKTKKDARLVIIASFSKAKLSQEDREIYESRNLKIPQDKTVLRILFGSDHKPFNKDYYGEIIIDEKDLKEYNSPELEGYEKRIATLINMFDKIDKKMIFIADEESTILLEKIFSKLKQFNLCNNIVKPSSNEIRTIFKTIPAYENVNSNVISILIISLIISCFLIINTITNNYINSSISQKTQKIINNLKDSKNTLHNKLLKAINENKELNELYNKEKNIYKVGTKYDY